MKKKKKLQAKRDEHSVQRQEQLSKQQEIRKLYEQKNAHGSGSEGDENGSESEKEEEQHEEEEDNFDDFQHLQNAMKFASANLDSK